MEISLLTKIVVIFGITVVMLFVCNRLKIPSIVGFLLSGMLAGPYGLQLIALDKDVEAFAEIGIVMLLFTIGIEFSFDSLLRLKRFLLIGGTLQVFLTIALIAGLGHFGGLSWGTSIFAGFLISLSSTAIVLKLLQQKDEVASPHGKLILSILIFQDIIAIPMMLFTPMLAHEGGSLGMQLLILIAKAVGIVIFTIITAKWVVPKVLYQVAKMRNNELFILTIIVLCFAVAWLTSSLGLSISLGAFLAGLIISESEYSHYTFSTVMPFRDVFTSFFFISIGMLFDYRILYHHPIIVVVGLVAVFIGKNLVAAIASLLLGGSLRTVLLTAFALSQVGEFAFVLSKSGLKYGLLDNNQYQLFLAVSILSMGASPLMIALSYKVSNLLKNSKLNVLVSDFSNKMGGKALEVLPPDGFKDHVMIIGFGVIGKNVAQAAEMANIPYCILEMNVETVRKKRQMHLPIYYGDATQEGILKNLNIEHAKVVVIAIPDLLATRTVVSMVRNLNKDVMIVVRTRYVSEMQMLYDLGADEVIPEEFETSIEMFTLVLLKYMIPKTVIDEVIYDIRANGYAMLRSPTSKSPANSIMTQYLMGVEMDTLLLSPNSALIGKTLIESELRNKYEINLLAIIRKDEVIVTPHADESFKEYDRLVIFGAPEQLRIFIEIHSKKKRM